MFGGTGTGGSGGFTFGVANQATTASTATTGGLKFGSVQPTTGLLGSTTTANTGTAGGFTFGTTPAPAATSTSSLLAQALNAPNTTSAGTTGLGSTAAPSLFATPSLSLGGAAKTQTGATALSLGATTTAASSTAAPAFGTLGATSTLGKPATTLGGLTTGGFSFGKTTATTGLTVNKTTAVSGFSLGGTLTTTSAATGLSTTTTGGSVFGNITSKPQTTGLGGVDPKTSQATAGGTTTDAKPGDGKKLKESQLPPEIVATVDDFQKYVKDEKSVQDNLARMSSKPMYKVQEDVAALKQLLSVVSNGIQRNTCAVEKLKREMTQELKNAEMAQRTRDIPPGLQYENTAPNEYFQKLVEDFEHQMLSYRQQIETLEGHLASLHQPSKLSPEELIGLMRKLHEAFIALAAQLHHVHEAVKTQKEHYLNYRKIFLHDTKDIFDREKKATSHAKLHASSNLGPNPFTGMSNAAAIAMASALSRSQQPAGGPPVAGLGGTSALGVGGSSLFGTTTTAGIGFGSTTTTQATGFTGFGFGSNTQASGLKGFGAVTTTTQSTGFGGTATFGGGGTSTFGGASFGGFGGTSGGTATIRPLGFGTNLSTGNLYGGGSTGFNLSSTQPASNFGLASSTPTFGVANPTPDTPFQLNKPPPPGSKRGKR